jgi:hypothetical protein
MADDNTLRSYRPNDALRRESAPASGRDRSNDPLVELARLIGQTDPFAEVGRGNARDLDAPDDVHQHPHPEVRQHIPEAPPVADWRGTPPPYALMRSRVASPPPVVSIPRDDYADRYAPRHAPTPSYKDAGYSQPETRQTESVASLPATSGYEDTPYDDTNYAAAAQDGDHDVAYYGDGATEQQEEAIYDEAPPARRRSGMLTAVTLIGCAMLGTAGAYGYRNYHSHAEPSAAPVIVADKTPTKIVPAADAQASKAIQDRVGDTGTAERVVPREEQPVTLKVPTPPAVLPEPAAPVAPSAPANTASIADLAAAPPPAAASPPPAPVAPSPSAASSNEPKRVRTVTIRSDGSDPSSHPVGASTRGAPAAKAAHGGPLQLDPQQFSETTPAAAPARPLTPPAPRLASAPTGGSRGYVVQVSSQKSEAEAEASFRSMQTKYPSAFSGRSPIIRRADLGAKGVFYRALVGPFASSGDAGHFCSSLKAAGGQCIVQRN